MKRELFKVTKQSTETSGRDVVVVVGASGMLAAGGGGGSLGGDMAMATKIPANTVPSADM